MQKTSSNWLPALLWIASIVTAGILAIPYLLWRHLKNNENIQEVKMKPTEFALVQQHTQRVLNSTVEAQNAMAANPILGRAGKPQKALPDVTADPTTEQTYLMDVHAKGRFELMQGMFRRNEATINAGQLAVMQSLTDKSVALAPSIR